MLSSYFATIPFNIKDSCLNLFIIWEKEDLMDYINQMILERFFYFKYMYLLDDRNYTYTIYLTKPFVIVTVGYLNIFPMLH